MTIEDLEAIVRGLAGQVERLQVRVVFLEGAVIGLRESGGSLPAVTPDRCGYCGGDHRPSVPDPPVLDKSGGTNAADVTRVCCLDEFELARARLSPGDHYRCNGCRRRWRLVDASHAEPGDDPYRDILRGGAERFK